jgi:hypothetical protein
MNDTKTATANYQLQYLLTVNTFPAEVLTLNPLAVSGGGWYDSGATATVNAVQLVDKIAGASRYDFRSWTGAILTGPPNQATVFMNDTKTATANYQLQYYLTMATNFGTVSPGSGWQDEGLNVLISATAPIPGPGMTYNWIQWHGIGDVNVDGGSPTGNSVTMNSPIFERAEWSYGQAPPNPTVGGAAVPTTVLEITIDLMGEFRAYPVTPGGALLVDVIQTSPDGSLTLEIPTGTVVLNPDGTPAYMNLDPDVFEILAGTPTPPSGATIVQAYQLLPSGIIFEGNTATLAAKYDPADVPAGKTLVWAFYDETAGKWVELETAGYVAAATGVPAVDTTAAKIAHFTYFALIAR